MGKTATIESGPELPEPSSAKSYGVDISISDTIRKMEPGQSFVVDGHPARVRALQVGLDLKISVTSRRETTADGVERYRIWRRHD